MAKIVHIVFEETGEFEGKGFNVYLDGVNKEVYNMTDEERITKLSPADFWGFECFKLCADIMRKAGALHSVRPKDN